MNGRISFSMIPVVAVGAFSALAADAYDDIVDGAKMLTNPEVIEGGEVTAAFETSIGIPVLETYLYPNHPNPFNPTATIGFAVASETQGTLAVYDVSEKHVRTPVDRTVGPGMHEKRRDGIDSAGNRVTTGVYFLRLQSGNLAQTRTMVLIK